MEIVCIFPFFLFYRRSCNCSDFELAWTEGSQGEPKVYQWSVVRPSSSVVVRRRPSSSSSSSSVVVHTFKLEYLWSQVANIDQILCIASLGWRKGCIRFWGILDQNCGFHGNRKLPLTYNGENDVFSRLFFIRSFINLQVTRTCIKSRTSSNFGQFGSLTTELAALERLKKIP